MRNDSAMAIIAVIVLIVGMAVAGLLYTFTTVLSGETYEIVEEDLDAISSYSSKNMTFTASNTSWTLLRPLLKQGSVHLYNRTTWTDNTSHFDINYTTGKVNLTLEAMSENTLHGTTMTAVFEYDDENIKNAVKGGIRSNFEAQQQIGDYLPLIVLAIVITIVIGVIIAGIAQKIMIPGNRGNNIY